MLALSKGEGGNKTGEGLPDWKNMAKHVAMGMLVPKVRCWAKPLWHQQAGPRRTSNRTIEAQSLIA